MKIEVTKKLIELIKLRRELGAKKYDKNATFSYADEKLFEYLTNDVINQIDLLTKEENIEDNNDNVEQASESDGPLSIGQVVDIAKKYIEAEKLNQFNKMSELLNRIKAAKVDIKYWNEIRKKIKYQDASDVMSSMGDDMDKSSNINE